MYTTNHHQLGFSPPPGAVKPLDGLDVRRRRAFGVVKKLADLKEAAEAFAGMRLGSARGHGKVDFHRGR